MVRRGVLQLLALGLLVVVASGPTEAQGPELQRYYISTRDICRTGVTREIEAAYREAVKAMEQARAAGKLGNNFAGIKPPEQIWLDCFQSPGDGKF
jgi:hypothetical protein